MLALVSLQELLGEGVGVMHRVCATTLASFNYYVTTETYYSSYTTTIRRTGRPVGDQAHMHICAHMHPLCIIY